MHTNAVSIAVTKLNQELLPVPSAQGKASAVPVMATKEGRASAFRQALSSVNSEEGLNQFVDMDEIREQAVIGMLATVAPAGTPLERLTQALQEMRAYVVQSAFNPSPRITDGVQLFAQLWQDARRSIPLQDSVNFGLDVELTIFRAKARPEAGNAGVSLNSRL